MAMVSRRSAPFVGFLLLAGCQVVPDAPAPAPSPPPPAPAPAPVPPPQPDLSWEQAPVAPGDWRYGEEGGLKVATFGLGASDRNVTLTCRAATRQIELGVQGAPPSAQSMTIRTSFGALQWAGAVTPGDGTATLRVSRPASDTGLDWIAYSRGRVSIEVAGGARLIVPAWAEIGRVLEDCRN